MIKEEIALMFTKVISIKIQKQLLFYKMVKTLPKDLNIVPLIALDLILYQEQHLSIQH
jgi:hypothetical protein